jgi:hypothetical protein
MLLIIYTHPFLVRRSSGVSSTCLTNSKRGCNEKLLLQQPKRARLNLPIVSFCDMLRCAGCMENVSGGSRQNESQPAVLSVTKKLDRPLLTLQIAPFLCLDIQSLRWSTMSILG